MVKVYWELNLVFWVVLFLVYLWRLNDHPMACASLTSDSSGASMEMMVARSLREDDGRGLAQGVHDSSRSRAPTYILLDESVRSQGKYRRYSQYLHHPLRTYLAAPSGGKNDGAAPINTNAWRNQHVDSFAPMSSLPNGLHLLTFKAHDVSAPTDFYVRLKKEKSCRSQCLDNNLHHY